MAQATLDFWFEFASTYTYPAAMRLDAAAAACGVAVRWRPFLLGPIFAELGWHDSPFNLHPVKGRYMWRDLARTCRRHGLPFVRPDPFPQHSVLAARIALVALDCGWGPAFCRAVFDAEFGQGRPIADRAVLAELVEAHAAQPNVVLAEAESQDNKARLRAATAEAQSLGIFGAPSFVTADGELFWGHDRLGEALDWAAGLRAVSGWNHRRCGGIQAPTELRQCGTWRRFGGSRIEEGTWRTHRHARQQAAVWAGGFRG